MTLLPKRRNRRACYRPPMGEETASAAGDRTRILQAVGDHLREHGQPPASVFRLCQQLEISERTFFTHFPTLEAAEGAIWTDLMQRVVHAVESGPEWAEFSARQRLLAFYFAFGEESLGMRSILLARLGKCGALARPPWLRGFEELFREFAQRIVERGLAQEEIADRGQISSIYPGALYTQFRSIIDFHLKDVSPGYERTDAYIEKSVTLAFELLRKQALDAAFDLVRFLIPRRS